jgi:phosphohistidine phosphatase
MASRLLVLRHGEAESFLSAGSDSARQLTDFGRQQIQLSLAVLNSKGLTPDIILASPYVRAQQSAECARTAYPKAEFQTWQALVPESDVFQLSELLQQQQQKTILLVSHQPFVSGLLSYLCGQPSGRYPMDTASLACLESDSELWVAGLSELKWLYHTR